MFVATTLVGAVSTAAWAGPSLDIRVFDPEDGPAEGYLVVVLPATAAADAEATVSGRTGTDGHVVLEVPEAGVYKVTIARNTADRGVSLWQSRMSLTGEEPIPLTVSTRQFRDGLSLSAQTCGDALSRDQIVRARGRLTVRLEDIRHWSNMHSLAIFGSFLPGQIKFLPESMARQLRERFDGATTNEEYRQAVESLITEIESTIKAAEAEELPVQPGIGRGLETLKAILSGFLEGVRWDESLRRAEEQINGCDALLNTPRFAEPAPEPRDDQTSLPPRDTGRIDWGLSMYATSGVNLVTFDDLSLVNLQQGGNQNFPFTFDGKVTLAEVSGGIRYRSPDKLQFDFLGKNSWWQTFSLDFAYRDGDSSNSANGFFNSVNFTALDGNTFFNFNNQNVNGRSTHERYELELVPRLSFTGSGENWMEHYFGLAIPIRLSSTMLDANLNGGGFQYQLTSDVFQVSAGLAAFAGYTFKTSDDTSLGFTGLAGINITNTDFETTQQVNAQNFQVDVNETDVSGIFGGSAKFAWQPLPNLELFTEAFITYELGAPFVQFGAPNTPAGITSTTRTDIGVNIGATFAFDSILTY